MTSKGKKILLGILAVFGAFVVLIVVAVVAFVTWISQPGELIEPERLLSADATGYAEWTLREGDPGTEGFLMLLSGAMQDLAREVNPGMPGFAGSWSQGDGTDLLPIVVGWTAHPARDAGQQDLHLLSVSAERLGNQIVLADWIAGFALSRSRDPDVSVQTHRDETIYRLRQPRRNVDLTLFVRRGAVFLTSDLDTARQAVDLLAEEPAATGDQEAAARPATDLERLFSATSPDDALRAAMTNATGELVRMWQAVSSAPIEGPDAWRDIEGASLSGGLQADGSFTGSLRLRVADPAAAAAYVPIIPTTVGVRTGTFETRVEIQPMAVADGLQLDLRIPDLVEGLAAQMRGADRPRDRR